MSLLIELGPNIEADLALQAAIAGVPLDEYVRTLLARHMPRARVHPVPMSHSDRARAFEDWVRKFPYRRTEPLSDDAISRESFYLKDDG